MDSYIVTLIGFACTLVGNYFIYLKRSKEDSEERAKLEQKQNDRLDQIDKKLDEHNGYAKLFHKNANDIAEIKSDNKVMRNDIQYLKEEINHVQMCKTK